MQNDRFCDKHTCMKPISSLLNGGTKKNPRYSVHFDDGITLILSTKNSKLVYENMLSVGLGSYYLKTGKWPAGDNLNKRVEMAQAYIDKNKKNNRYRKKLKDEPGE